MPASRAKAADLKPTPGAATHPAWVTPELIAETIRVWQPYYAADLTAADAVEILLNVSRLLGALSGGVRDEESDGAENESRRGVI